MVLYLHSLYNGGKGGFSLDEWSKYDECFYGVKELPADITYAEAMKIAESLGAKKVVLDF